MADPEVKNEASPIGEEDVAMEDIAEAPTATPDPPKPKEEVRLEDLFADSDSDEEFPASSRPPAAKNGNSQDSQPEASSPPMTVPPLPSDIMDMKASDPEIMRTFYQRLFPWRYLFQWLNHSPDPSTDFGHREFAFTLQNDAYLRYQSFPTHDLLRKDILRLMPSRFEIGPIYTLNPRDRKSNPKSFRPSQKELCFDIDLTDYDSIRTCCSAASICRKCWSFMTMAIKVLDSSLREDFGFKHILWVYSGRRGAHAWVCDRSARSLDDPKRRAIAGYLEVIKGGSQTGKKVNLWRPLHPHLVRSLEILKPHFQEDVLAVQNPWSGSQDAEKLLRLLPDAALNESLRRKWDYAPGRSSVSKWNDIDSVAKSSGGGGSRKLDTRTLLEAKQDVVLEYSYPRLDIEVSKKLNHLLKSPFVVHPGTGRVCVPIDTKELEEFDPLGVPTVQELIREIDEWEPPGNSRHDSDREDHGNGKANGSGTAAKPIQDWEKTSLKPYIEHFRYFVAGLMKDERGKHKEKDGQVRPKREREEATVPGSDAMEF